MTARDVAGNCFPLVAVGAAPAELCPIAAVLLRQTRTAMTGGDTLQALKSMSAIFVGINISHSRNFRSKNGSPFGDYRNVKVPPLTSPGRAGGADYLQVGV